MSMEDLSLHVFLHCVCEYIISNLFFFFAGEHILFVSPAFMLCGIYGSVRHEILWSRRRMLSSSVGITLSIPDSISKTASQI